MAIISLSLKNCAKSENKSIDALIRASAILHVMQVKENDFDHA